MTLRDVTRAVEAYSYDRGVDSKKTLKDAKVAVRAWAEGLRAIGVDVPPWKPPQARGEAIETLLGEYCQHRWLRRGVTHASLRVECRFVRKFLFVLKRRRRAVASIALEDIDGFISELGRRLKPKTIAGACSALRSFLRFLHASGRVPEDLSSSVLGPLVGAAERPPRVLPWGDVQRIIAAIDQHTVAGKRDFALLIFLYNSGAGVSEALAVRGSDLQLRRPRQVRLHGKGSKDRICPLWQDTSSALRQLLQRAELPHDGPIFRNARGEPLTRDGVAYIISKHHRSAAREKTTLRRKRMTPHVMRHSCAVGLLQSGADLTVIRDYLGHASIATTGRYVKTNLQMKRHALNAFWQRAGLAPARSTPWKPNTGHPDVPCFTLGRLPYVEYARCFAHEIRSF